ncbi:MAG TPA: helix-turn-helix domain-containing protein [Vulgatibacter sp.]|nr:helix-turn-helix domain-containing protein [Vulgatibacter sp.]
MQSTTIDTQTERLVDIDEARRTLGNISRPTIYRLFDSGALRGVKIGRRRLVPASEIQRYINAAKAAA